MRTSFLKEFWKFLRVRKKFWLLPVLLPLILLWWRRSSAVDSVAQLVAGNNFEEHTGGLLTGVE
jgi:hypothetical protein